MQSGLYLNVSEESPLMELGRDGANTATWPCRSSQAFCILGNGPPAGFRCRMLRGDRFGIGSVLLVFLLLLKRRLLYSELE